ncbi:V-type ATPase subunit [Halothermothrix orenii]|uniref:H(+)-transporting two-sector ATPase n=1 Tax=Halothermothrix orenii (strain H 168 / OCM 544 / DSM 9562) TaxID=373903 RepID=B8CZH3_HALOH|nr:V-type ATPase subunit [Halothermothrix orenii]ACL70692.1 H(+)-transporting two-sector ATPase [Halothermothrix orenii H 168]
MGMISYAGVNAKVKALFGKMLSEEDYNNLINQKSVQDIFDYLYQNTHYREYLEELAGVEIHRRQLERTLKKNFIRDFKAILRYLTGPIRDFFKFFLIKFEIEDLKMLLRTSLIEHDEEYLKNTLVYMGIYEDISLDRLTSINNYHDLLEVFKGTQYYDTLERFEERYMKDKNLFPIEMTLDFNYFIKLAQLVRRLRGEDYRIIRDLLGTQVDLLNIQWIYRTKRYYNLNTEEILNYTIPIHYRLSAKDLKNLSQSSQEEEIFNYLSKTDYDELFSPVAHDKSILFEKYFLSYLLKKAYHTKISGTSNVGVIISYTFIKEYEIRDIITVVEGVRYSLRSEDIKNYLIRDLK